MSNILFLYESPSVRNADALIEHFMSFKLSKFPTLYVNTWDGFPAFLKPMQFDIIVLHFSVLGFLPDKEYPPMLGNRFVEYLVKSRAYKVAIAQDEMHFCRQRFNLFNLLKINCLYTLYEKQYWKDTYHKYTNIPTIVYTIPGFVGSELLNAAQRWQKPYAERTIDIGYRGRQAPAWLGYGGYEKGQIAEEFKNRVNHMSLDIETAEDKRLYHDDWWKFLGNCKAVLGAEAGGSITDLDDRVRIQVGQKSYQEAKTILEPYENNIPYRMASPRIFEAAAFRNIQILFEGYYSGILRPDTHYIPLKKDFSNLSEVLEKLQDRLYAISLTENAYHNLITSGRYSYGQFIKSFDEQLESQGFHPSMRIWQIPKTLLLATDRPIRPLSRRSIWYVHKSRRLYFYLKGKIEQGRATLLGFVRGVLK